MRRDIIKFHIPRTSSMYKIVLLHVKISPWDSKALISLGILIVGSRPSLSAYTQNDQTLQIILAGNNGSVQTRRMCRFIWAFIIRICSENCFSHSAAHFVPGHRTYFILPFNTRPQNMMIFSLVVMIGLEKCCITSAYLQWLCHSGERAVARGYIV